MSQIKVTPDELSVLADMVSTYYECKKYDWDKYEIHDKRHNKDKRKEALKAIYNDALRVELAVLILRDAEIVDATDEDLPWVNNDMLNLLYLNPLNHVRWLAKEAKLEDYLEDLEENNDN